MNKAIAKIEELKEWINQNCTPDQLSVLEYQEFLALAIRELNIRLMASTEMDDPDAF